MPSEVENVDKGEIASVLYILPPSFLMILARYEATQALVEEAFQLIVDDEAWEQELQRRRRIEAKLYR